VLLRKPRAQAEVYNDLDGEIVNVFRVARDHGQKLMHLLELTPFAREEFNACFQPAANEIERARRMIARSFLGMGACAHGKPGGFRANTKTVVHSHNWRTFPTKFFPIIDRLRGVIVENRDALEVMAIHDSPTTLHYVDPPYVKSTRISTTVYRHEMTDEQHRALAAALGRLKGTVIVSGYPSPLYQKLYAGWQRVARPAHAHGDLPRTEVLWIRAAACRAAA
jgi:DNA adenine methylase